MQQSPSVKAFLSTPAGKIALTVLATLALVGSFLELGVLIAIATFLLLMLAVPIYLGWRRPRQLALAGIVAILIAAPITSVLYAEQLRTPVVPIDSPSQNGGAVLTGAQVSPFSADTGSTFTFSVTVHPQFLPNGSRGPEYLLVYLSTCPGATTSNLTVCGGGGYPFWELNHSFAAALNATTNVTVTKVLQLPDLWWWVMAFVYQDASNTTQWVWVGVSDAGSGIQGPITGDLGSTIALILPTVYGAFFFDFLIVFLGALVIYMFFKSRRDRRNPPGDAGPLPGGGRPQGPADRATLERSCPSCGAVVYPEEKACWKCGTPLTGGPSAISPAPPAAPPPLAP